LAVNLSNVINASTFRAVSLGKDHSCAIASNGKGYCWGANADGQTGVGSTATTLVPSSIAESNFSGETGLISISAGELHSCAVAGDGIGYCWGKGTSGQLGTGASASQSSPSQVNINSFSPDKDKTWRNLIAGSNHTCGLTTDGTVYCFGSNSAGQLGSLASGVNSTTASALDLSSVHEFSAFTQISVGGDSACGITGKGAIYCWGNGVSNILGRERTTGASAVADIINTSSIAGSRVFRSVSLSNNFACAIAGDGVPYCWGDDTYGRLGNGLLLHASRPGPVDRTTISGNKAFLQVELGSDHACGLTVDGKAFCWGRDVAGSLGDGGIDSDNQWPVAVDLSDITGDKNITAVSAFHYTSFAITGSGKGMGWGYDYYEGLGVGSASSAVRPTLLDYTSVTGDQTVLRFAESGYRYQSCFLTTAGAPYCWGINDTGEAGVGNNSRLSRPTAVSRTPISGEKAFRTITIGSVHGCGVTGDGTPYCWGSANNGRIGTGVGASSTYVPAPVATNGMPAAKSKAFTTVEAWNATSCGLTGDGEAYCWGYNGALTIGDPTITPVGADQFTPRAVVMSDVKQMNGMVAISPGNDHTCGLDESGKAFCWGLASPRLGQGSVTATVTAPTAVLTAGLPAGTTWTQIGSGRDFSCALSAANQVYCWGADDAGQIGNAGINQISSLPIAIDQSALLPGEWFTDISVNVVYTCGRTNLRQQYCWGYNGHGAIGDNTTVNRQTAVLTNLSPLVGPKSNAVLGVGSSSAYSSCVLSDFDTSLYCWGLNDKGQIGNGTLVNQSQPVAVDRSNIPNGTQFKMVSTGRWATCAVDTSDNLWCWGTADVPVVGETTSLVPRLQDLGNLPVESEIVDLSVGDGHACLLTQNGDPYCWGYNLDYRTGVSSDNPANVLKPTKVDMSRVEGIKKFRSVRVSVSTTCAISWMGQAYCWGNDTNERLGDGQSGGIARIPQRVNLTQK
jgi:alpha-tubulin suppressor-like RCC1 family protein